MELKSKVVGCLYALACGDALGVPSSFMTQKYVAKRWGWIDTFYPPEKGHIYHDGLQAGEYTDDTEQSLALMNSFIRNRKVVPSDIVNELLLWAERVSGKYASPLGPSTEKALKAIKGGADITKSGRYGNTNGSAMRIAPVGIIHGLLQSSTLDDLVRDVYMTCMPTHNTSVCVSGAAAVAWGVACCIRGERDIKVVLREMIQAAQAGVEYGYEIASPSIARRMQLALQVVEQAPDEKAAMNELYAYFGGGDLTADSIPSAFGLLALGKGDPKKVIELCVNFGGDCDTNAAMAGSIAGAYAGLEKVPADWIDTIKKVNHVDMEAYAEKLEDLVSHWQIADKESCLSCFVR